MMIINAIQAGGARPFPQVMILTISKSLQRIPKSAMRSRDVKIQIFNELSDVLDHVLRFTRCKDLEIVKFMSSHVMG